MKVELAFYKGEGLFFNRLIRFWKRSIYSHVEIKIGDALYSSSDRDGGVRVTRFALNPNHWDVVEVPNAKPEKIDRFFRDEMGKKYDFWGIIASQIFASNRHKKSKWFCSEICAAALGLSEPNRYCPQALYNLMQDYKRLSS